MLSTGARGTMKSAVIGIEQVLLTTADFLFFTFAFSLNLATC
jgi:hypothetical protein